MLIKANVTEKHISIFIFPETSKRVLDGETLQIFTVVKSDKSA